MFESIYRLFLVGVRIQCDTQHTYFGFIVHCSSSVRHDSRTNSFNANGPQKQTQQQVDANPRRDQGELLWSKKRTRIEIWREQQRKQETRSKETSLCPVKEPSTREAKRLQPCKDSCNCGIFFLPLCIQLNYNEFFLNAEGQINTTSTMRTEPMKGRELQTLRANTANT